MTLLEILKQQLLENKSAELSVMVNENYITAAVLVLIVRDTQEIILTQRSEHLTNHSGQISFPGGRYHNEDGNIITTALREAHEEIGILPQRVTVLGELDPVMTLSGFCVYPIVGSLDTFSPFKLNPHEVARLIKLPLHCLLKPEEFKQYTVFINNQFRDVYSLHFQDENIWGATAKILYSLTALFCKYPLALLSNGIKL